MAVLIHKAIAEFFCGSVASGTVVDKEAIHSNNEDFIKIHGNLDHPIHSSPPRPNKDSRKHVVCCVRAEVRKGNSPSRVTCGSEAFCAKVKAIDDQRADCMTERSRQPALDIMQVMEQTALKSVEAGFEKEVIGIDELGYVVYHPRCRDYIRVLNQAENCGLAQRLEVLTYIKRWMLHLYPRRFSHFRSQVDTRRVPMRGKKEEFFSRFDHRPDDRENFDDDDHDDGAL